MISDSWTDEELLRSKDGVLKMCGFRYEEGIKNASNLVTFGARISVISLWGDDHRILALSRVSYFDYINIKSSSKKVIPRMLPLSHHKAWPSRKTVTIIQDGRNSNHSTSIV